MQQRAPQRKQLPARSVSLSLYEQGKSLPEIAVELGTSDKQAGRKLVNDTEKYACDLLEQIACHQTILAELREQYRLLARTLIRMKQDPPPT
jgi:hypothetical protein